MRYTIPSTQTMMKFSPELASANAPDSVYVQHGEWFGRINEAAPKRKLQKQPKQK